MFNEKLAEAQESLAVAVEGSGNEAVESARAALAQAAQELEDCLAATIAATEQAESYVATL